MASNAQGVKNGVYITQQIMKAFGLKDYLAVGFAGCWMCESACNPGAYNKAEKNGTFKGSSANGAGYGAGLAQWSNSWKQKIQNTLNRHSSIETWTMDLQIEIVTKCCVPSFINMLRNAKDAALSTDIILRGYENGSGGYGTALRSQKSMEAYTWCKKSYIPDIGYKTFANGYIGALTARTAWSNIILKAMGSNAYGDLSSLGNMSFGSDESSFAGGNGFGGSTGFGDSNAYPTHSEYETFTGGGGNIFSNSGANAFAHASMIDSSTINSTQTEHTRIYSTNDSCIVLDELALPTENANDSYANKDTKKKEETKK